MLKTILNNHLLTLENLTETAKKLISLDPACRVFLFEAPMGAGKTTLIKEMCHCLGSHDNFSSPTYSLVNEYVYPGGNIYHMDLYRLKNSEELLEIGFDHYINSGQYCFIEWPELAEDIISSDYIRISILPNNNNRYISATKLVPRTS